MDINEFKAEMWSSIYQVKVGIQKFAESILQSEGITMIQAHILFRLSEGEANNISSLCKDIGINQGNVSSMCKQMEKAELIIRSRSSIDERIVTLSLTDRGKDVLKRLQTKADELDEIFEQISPEKLDTIVKGMQEFNELLKIISEKTTRKGR